MTKPHLLFPLFVLASLVTFASSEASADPHAPALLALEQNCLECHHPDTKQKGGLYMHTREALLEGGDTDAAINVDAPLKSELLRRLELDPTDDEFMPPSSKKHPRPPLSSSQTEAIRQWLLAGAPLDPSTPLQPKKRPKSLPTTTAELDLSAITAYPSRLFFTNQSDAQTVTVIGTLSSGAQVDLTSSAKVTPKNGVLLENTGGTTFRAQKDGATVLTVSFQKHRTEVPVVVTGAESARRVSFHQDVIPVLTAGGCNTGACHGAARGQDGFMLSLFGYDPAGDYHRLTRELSGRRLNLAVPDNSLLLTKATNTVPHSGNELFSADHPFYKVLHQWIQEGANPDQPDIALPVSISVEPASFTLGLDRPTLPLQVTATYSDGSARDVTSLTTFSSSDDSALAVEKSTGLVTAKRWGEAFVLARFHTFTEGSQGIVLPKIDPTLAETYPSRNAVDVAINQKLRRLRLDPSPPASDPIFLRRVYLDLIGRLPTLQEKEAFLADSSPERRDRLVDQLLANPRFTDVWVMKWAELLQIRSTGRASNTITPKASRLWHNWLAAQIKSGKPFNQIIHSLLSSTGGTFEKPQTNFYKLVRDPKIQTENIAQVFMGTRIQCAQCHNHPFDRWTMDDYYGFASFLAGVKRKGAADPAEQIIFDGNGSIKHPLTNQPVPPKFLGGTQTKIPPKKRRQALADWLTAPDNPWFARNVANIMWAHFFGQGVVEPVDDVRISNPPSNPALLDALEKRLIESNFSLQELARFIVQSEAYQRSSQSTEHNKTDQRNFAKSPIRRLRAETLLDVVAQVTGTQNKFTGLERGESATKIPDGTTTNYFLRTFGRATRKTVCSCEVTMEPNLSQALHLLNGNTVSNRIRQGNLVDRLLNQKQTPEQILDHLYQLTLTRQPTATEKAHLAAQFTNLPDKKSRRLLLEDIFWALLNSKEFLFNH